MALLLQVVFSSRVNMFSHIARFMLFEAVCDQGCQGQSQAAVEVRCSVFPSFRQSYHGHPHAQEVKVVLTLQHRHRNPVASVASPFLNTVVKTPLNMKMSEHSRVNE